MKANMHKVQLYIVDAEGDYKNIDEIMNILERFTNCSYQLASSETVEFEWDDDLDINKISATNECYEKYFKC